MAAQPPLSGPDLPLCRTMDDYDRLLRQKRRELDREIEVFHARKEKEYIQFQRALKAELNREKDRQRESEAAAALAAAAEASSNRGKAGALEQPTDESPVEERQPLRAGGAQPQGVFASSDQRLSAASGQNDPHPAHDPVSPEDDEGSDKQPEPGRRRKRSDAPGLLSSSLTLSRNAYGDGPSSTSSRGLEQVAHSSSAPRPGMAERRSSSRSDTSAGPGNSLRSVLRQPRSPDGSSIGGGASAIGNKSPKHVLFSIDNTVVAPSSSPNLTRHPEQEEQQQAAVEALAAAADGSRRNPANVAASVLSMRTIPPGLRMTPVRVPSPPTPPLGSLRSRGDGYFELAAQATGSAPPTSHPTSSDPQPPSALKSASTSALPSSTASSAEKARLFTAADPSAALPPVAPSPTSSSAPTFTARRFMPLSIDVAAAAHGIAMRRSSSGSGGQRTPSSAVRAAELLDPTVPAHEQESAGGVPDVLAHSPGADPLFDFDREPVLRDLNDDDGFEDIDDDDDSSGSNSSGGGRRENGKTNGSSKKSKKTRGKEKEKGKKSARKKAAKDRSPSDSDDAAAARDQPLGAVPASLPIEIRWPSRKRS